MLYQVPWEVLTRGAPSQLLELNVAGRTEKDHLKLQRGKPVGSELPLLSRAPGRELPSFQELMCCETRAALERHYDRPNKMLYAQLEADRIGGELGQAPPMETPFETFESPACEASCTQSSDAVYASFFMARFGA